MFRDLRMPTDDSAAAPNHSCADSLTRLEALRNQRDDLTPNDLKARVSQIELCHLCWQRLRNVYPRQIAAVEAAEVGRRNAGIRAADAERFDALNEAARRGATTQRVNWNPHVSQTVSSTERKRNEEEDWLLGKAATFPMLTAENGG